MRLAVHHSCEARIGDHFGVDLVAVRARLEHDPREQHRLARLQLHAARERCDLAGLHVVGDAFPVVHRAVLAPDLAGLGGEAAIGLQVPLGQRHYEAIDVRHAALLRGGAEDSTPRVDRRCRSARCPRSSVSGGGGSFSVASAAAPGCVARTGCARRQSTSDRAHPVAAVLPPHRPPATTRRPEPPNTAPIRLMRNVLTDHSTACGRGSSRRLCDMSRVRPQHRAGLWRRLRKCRDGRVHCPNRLFRCVA